MHEILTRRTILTSLCLASLPIQAETKGAELPATNSKFLNNVLPIDSDFIAIDGWVLPTSNLVKRAK